MLERCLEKEIKNRYGSINDARVDIQKVLADPSGVLVQHATTVESRMRLRTMLPWIAAAGVLCLIIGGVAVWKFKPTEPRQVMRFSYALPNDQEWNGSLAVSPDGRQFIYGANKGLYLRSIDELDARLIPETEGSVEPFFSPDGKWVGYWSLCGQEVEENQRQRRRTSGFV